MTAILLILNLGIAALAGPVQFSGSASLQGNAEFISGDTYIFLTGSLSPVIVGNRGSGV